MNRDSVYNVGDEQKGSSVANATRLFAHLSLDRDRHDDDDDDDDEPESPTSLLSEVSNLADDDNDNNGVDDDGVCAESGAPVPALAPVVSTTFVTAHPMLQVEVSSVQCGGKSVKGRAYQNEDTHIVHHLHTSSGEARYVFGVFDGHGGTSASAFCQQHFLSFVTRQPEFHQPRERQCRPAAAEMDFVGSSDSEALVSGHPASASCDRARGVSGATQASMYGELPKVTGQGVVHAPRHSGIGVSLAKAFLQCDEAFIKADRLRHAETRAAGGTGSPCPQGCAALVVVLDSHTLTVANAGDCRAVLCRQGRALPLSRDHRPEVPEERQRILAAGARIAGKGGKYCLLPRRDIGLTLSRSIGDRAFKECNQAIVSTPDVATMTITAGDRFMVLGCDGLWDYMSNEAVIEFIAKRLDKISRSATSDSRLDSAPVSEQQLQSVADDLVLQAIVKGSNDNVTVLIVLLHPTVR